MSPGFRRVAAAAAAVSLAAIPVALAAGRSFFRFETAADFLRGESEGVSVGPDGQVRLAPFLSSLHEAGHPFVWTLAAGASGTVVSGGGAPGALTRLGAGEPELVAETGDAGVHAVALGSDGTVYFASSPGGEIHRIDPGGERGVLGDTGARYVWAIVAEPGGSVLAATGMPASVVRVHTSGAPETLFTSRDENVTALHRGDDGTIHAGTAPSGIVFRIPPDGDAMALFDSPQQEIRALAVNAAGEVFAAAVAESPVRAAPAAAGAPAGPAAAGSVSVPVASVSTTTAFRVAAPPSGARSGGSANGEARNALYRISANGAAEAIWRSSRDRPLALAMLRDERLLLGTGDRGRVLRITREGEATLLLRTDSEQVTAAARGSDGILLGASNPGRVLRLADAPRTEGTYISPALDAGGAASFGRIAWDARVPPGTSLGVETRSGNTEEPDDTWSDWRAAESGSAVLSPAARFLQWRAVLRSDGSSSPELVSLEAAYLPANLAPRVTGITLHPPGRAFEEMFSQQNPQLQGMPHLPEMTEAARNGPSRGGLPAGSGRQLYRQGIRTATFEASDPNRDRLRYRVSWRRTGDVAWQLLRDGLREPIVAWDTRTMPDGRYELRVEARDNPDNPPESALSGERTSRPFTVDNTPPVISGLTVTAAGQVRFTAEDAGTPIRRATATVHGAEPIVILPTDGINDSTTETFDTTVAGVSANAATIVIAVEDDQGNTASQEAPRP